MMNTSDQDFEKLKAEAEVRCECGLLIRKGHPKWYELGSLLMRRNCFTSIFVWSVGDARPFFVAKIFGEIVLKIEFIIVKRTDFQVLRRQGDPDHDRLCLSLMKSINYNEAPKKRYYIRSSVLATKPTGDGARESAHFIKICAKLRCSTMSCLKILYVRGAPYYKTESL